LTVVKLLVRTSKSLSLSDPNTIKKHDKVLSNKTPKLDRSDGVKEMKEKAPKRKLPFTAGKKNVNRLELPGFLPRLVIKSDLIFI
uniref:Uncharacterized protein n=1 Tax=Seriola lalandi dorsalis TaxID=1841481 RepID=A0A3B4XGH3_SERLL